MLLMQDWTPHLKKLWSLTLIPYYVFDVWVQHISGLSTYRGLILGPHSHKRSTTELQLRSFFDFWFWDRLFKLQGLALNLQPSASASWVAAPPCVCGELTILKEVLTHWSNATKMSRVPGYWQSVSNDQRRPDITLYRWFPLKGYNSRLQESGGLALQRNGWVSVCLSVFLLVEQWVEIPALVFMWNRSKSSDN